MLFTWGELAEDISRGAREAGMGGRAAHFGEKKELVAALGKAVAKGDIVLVKGSRSMKMEEVVDALVRR